MEAPFPDEGSTYSDDGSARHMVCAKHLSESTPVHKSIGVHQRVRDGVTVTYKREWVDEDQDYVDSVRQMFASSDDGFFVEREVNFEAYAQVPGDSFGTLDAGGVLPLPSGGYELVVIDRKTGHGEVSPVRNTQLMLYALGLMAELGMVYDIKRVRLCIHQRRMTEWDCSIDELLAFANEARSRYATIQNAIALHDTIPIVEWERTFLNPTPNADDCRFCKAMAVCPSYTAAVQTATGCDFEDLTAASANDLTVLASAETDEARDLKMAAAPLLEAFCTAVRSHMERHLLNGGSSKRFKLVLGKAGARRWTDAELAETTLKSMRLKQEQMYDFTVISPTSAEKLAPKLDKEGKPKPGQTETPLGARQWAKLQPLIKRADPSPSVAPASDPRPAWAPTPPDPGFEALPDAQAVVDLC